jgi:hypothetical protein
MIHNWWVADEMASEDSLAAEVLRLQELLENLAPGKVLVDVENAYDRALRRAAERGLPVIVQPPLQLDWAVPMAAAPTLKSLLRKWAQAPSTWRWLRKLVCR